jgi:tRNA (guanine37-N1)-methyltransferase
VSFFAILTLFPEALEPYVGSGILRVAREKGLLEIQLVDFRDFTRDRHRTVDDRPFGGGPGMLLKPEPIAECIEWLERRHGAFHKIALCPSGQPFRQARAEQLRSLERVLLLCGRYEGFDTRLLEQFGFEELSIGDFVLAGGELPALCVVESVARLLPGVLNDERSALEESFGPGGVLDHPHYTRPRVFRGAEVPEVLLSGDHARIQRWREARARERTRERRPDLMPHQRGERERTGGNGGPTEQQP